MRRKLFLSCLVVCLVQLFAISISFAESNPTDVLNQLTAAIQSENIEALLGCYSAERTSFYYEMLPEEQKTISFEDVAFFLPVANFASNEDLLICDLDYGYSFSPQRVAIRRRDAEIELHITFSATSNDVPVSHIYTGFLYVQQIDNQWKISDYRTRADGPMFLYDVLGYNLNEIEDSTIYNKHGDTFFAIEKLPLAYGAWSKHSLDTIGLVAPAYEYTSIPRFNASSDTLVTTSARASYDLYAVERELFCYPASINYPTDGKLSIDHYYLDTSLSSSFSEIENQECHSYDELIAVLQTKGIRIESLDENYLGLGIKRFLVSDTPTRLSVGYYKGTQFHSATLPITTQMYIFSQHYECPVIQTKNGYFIIDTSSLPAGKYIIENSNIGWPGKYIIEITNSNASESMPTTIPTVTEQVTSLPPSSINPSAFILTGTAQGFQSNVSVSIITENNIITSLSVNASAETDGFGTRCSYDQAFLNQFLGKEAKEFILGNNVDAISGATVTSRAVVNAINIALASQNTLLNQSDLNSFQVPTTPIPTVVPTPIPTPVPTPRITPVPELWGLTTHKLSTRSGPSTSYQDMGTYNVQGQWIKVLSRAWDPSAGIWWVKCEIPYHNEIRVLWTGYKRFDSSTLPLESIPIE